jgi:membrane protein implicated in regulation of membrane protease activity
VTQSKLGSLLEAITNTVISYIIAVGVGHVVYGYYRLPVDLELNMKLTAIFTVASIVRSYLIRRWFNRRKL